MKARFWLFFGLGISLLVIVGHFTANVQAGTLRQVVATPTVNYKYALPFVANNPAPPPIPPPAAPSYYMGTLDPATVINQGCALGQRDVYLSGAQDSVVVLDFGYPQKYANGTFGARGFDYPPVYANTDQIAAVVENFGVGYINCSANDPASHLRIAIGTSNYPGQYYPAVTYAHGQAWSNMVTAVNTWFTTRCAGTACANRVDAAGANDIELAWNTPAATLDWLAGYASVAKYQMYNFGALDGCPWLAHPTYNCVWPNKDQVWTAIWGSPPVQPIPEIYRTDDINAEQWYLMSVYSYVNHHEKIQFIGPMTQTGACQQYPESSCTILGNTPTQAWWQLHNLLNGDPATAGEALSFPSDIRYMEKAP